MSLKRIPLHSQHEALGAKIVPFAGYEMPVRYTSDNEEHNVVRKGVGLFDVSHMGEFLVEGNKALDLLQWVTTNDVSKLQDGQIQYSCLPNGKGGIVDDLLVYRIDAEKYFLVVNASNIQKDWDWISLHNANFGAKLTNLSDDLALFALQGPKAVEVIKKVSNPEVTELAYYTFTRSHIADVQNLIVSATGYTGAGGFEIYVPNESALKVWEALIEAGKEFEISPIGLGARDTLRLEMGYCLYGNDITDHTSPIEAGLSWITKFSKDFVDKALLLKQKQEGAERKLVGFELLDRGVPRAHYVVTDATGHRIGEVTSGTQSPTLGKGIGMAYVAAKFADVDTELYIDVRGKLLKAKVVKLPFVAKGI